MGRIRKTLSWALSPGGDTAHSLIRRESSLEEGLRLLLEAQREKEPEAPPEEERMWYE